MRYAIFSDVHGNLEAFEAVIKDAKNQGADKFISLGDIIGYGPNPNQCVQLTQKIATLSLAGNHDWMVSHPKEIEKLNLYAQYALLWSIERLTPKNMDYLHKLPLVEQFDNLYFVHASPYKPAEWNYISNIENAKFNFQYFDQQICFIGHSHSPKILVKNGSASPSGKTYFIESGTEVSIEQENRYFFNVGSVGQPRDGNQKACYALYNILSKKIQLHRVSYDITATQKKMLLAGLPPFLSARLNRGQ